MKSNKGITLVSLISSILLIIILAATTVVTSMNAYNQMKFEGAKAELEEMQKLVDEIASDYQVYLKQTSNPESANYSNYFASRYNSDISNFKTIANSEVAANTKVKALIANFSSEINTSSENATSFYFSEDDLVKYFGLKGIEPIVVDFSTRTVYSVDGIKDSNNNNAVYYTPSQWGAKKITKVQAEDALGIDTMTKRSAKTVSAKESMFDIDIAFEGLLNTNISEVYFAEENSTSFAKVDSFRDITTSTDIATIIRITTKLDTSKNYKFKLVDNAKNVYISNAQRFTN